MRIVRIILALIVSIFAIGSTAAIHRQSELAAIAVALLFAIFITSFVVEYRRATQTRKARETSSGKTGVAVAQGAALTRLADGEISGTPFHKNG